LIAGCDGVGDNCGDSGKEEDEDTNCNSIRGEPDVLLDGNTVFVVTAGFDETLEL
jgi:hypothetical protein